MKWIAPILIAAALVPASYLPVAAAEGCDRPFGGPCQSPSGQPTAKRAAAPNICKSRGGWCEIAAAVGTACVCRGVAGTVFNPRGK